MVLELLQLVLGPISASSCSCNQKGSKLTESHLCYFHFRCTKHWHFRHPGLKILLWMKKINSVTFTFKIRLSSPYVYHWNLVVDALKSHSWLPQTLPCQIQWTFSLQISFKAMVYLKCTVLLRVCIQYPFHFLLHQNRDTPCYCSKICLDATNYILYGNYVRVIALTGLQVVPRDPTVKINTEGSHLISFKKATLYNLILSKRK